MLHPFQIKKVRQPLPYSVKKLEENADFMDADADEHGDTCFWWFIAMSSTTVFILLDRHGHIITENVDKTPAICHIRYARVIPASNLLNSNFNKNEIPRSIYGCTSCRKALLVNFFTLYHFLDLMKDRPENLSAVHQAMERLESGKAANLISKVVFSSVYSKLIDISPHWNNVYVSVIHQQLMTQ